MNILFDSESVLSQLSFNSGTIRAIKQGIVRSYYRASVNWLTRYNPNVDASNLERVKGLLEAIFHLCEVGDIENAWKIIQFRLNTPTQEYLLPQLRTWGYYQKSQDLCSYLLDKPLDDTKSAIVLVDSGVIYSSTGDYNQAINDYQKGLEIGTHSLDYSQICDIYCQGKSISIRLDRRVEKNLV